MEKKSIIDVMVDMETCSCKQDAAILSIALVVYNRYSQIIQREYHYGVDLASCFMAGMDFDKDTQRWWMEREPKQRASILQLRKRNIEEVAHDIYYILKSLENEGEVMLWSQGMDFDISKLDYLMERFIGGPPPYKVKNRRDLRTMWRELNIQTDDITEGADKHDALSDCRFQVEVLKKVFKRLSEH